MIARRVRWDSLWVEALWGLCLRNKKLAHFPEGPRPLHPHTNGDITVRSCFSSAALSGGRLEGSQAHRHTTGIPPAPPECVRWLYHNAPPRCFCALGTGSGFCTTVSVCLLHCPTANPSDRYGGHLHRMHLNNKL